MPQTRIRIAQLVFPLALAVKWVLPPALSAQSVTTASIEGYVRLASGESAAGTRVIVTNGRTGYVAETRVGTNRFGLFGLEVGGPYSILVQRLGYRVEARDKIHLSLGERLELDFVLESIAAPLDTIRILAQRDATIESTLRTGVGKLISDSALRRLPMIERDLYEFVRLVPQIVSGNGRLGLSGGGANPRFNSFLLDGVSDRGVLGNQAVGKSIPLDAVKEYQVLLSPYGIRYGDFTGALVNAVTKSGGNEVEGVAFAYHRNDNLARETPFLRGAQYNRTQFGLAVGGPIIPDRAHFFVAPEFQQLKSPAPGPYLGQDVASNVAMPVTAASIDSFAAALKGHGLDAGSPGAVQTGNPLRNLFARVDLNVPELRSRFIILSNYALGETVVFSRQSSSSFFTRGTTTFPLSSYRFASIVTKQVTAGQLLTNFPRGGLNEFLFAFKLQLSDTRPDLRSPLVSVAVPRSDATGIAYLESGTNEAAHGISVRQKSFELSDDVTLLAGSSHRIHFGARAEYFQVIGRGLPGSYGSWLFLSIDSLRAGTADRYRIVSESRPDRGAKPGVQIGVYAGDEWEPHQRLSIEAGVRGDIVTQSSAAPYNPVVDSIFGRRTSDNRRSRMQWSPRLGFNWAATNDDRAHVRGGVGLFVGRPPVGWLNQSLRYYGNHIGTLQCSPTSSEGGAPQFAPDYRSQPSSCANGTGRLGLGIGGQLDLEDPDLRLTEALRGSLSYDYAFASGLLWKVEGVLTRTRADFLFANLNLAGPVSTDRHGRAIYGTMDRQGRATPLLVDKRFSEVIDLQNHSGNHAFALSTELEKSLGDRLQTWAFYAYSTVKDVQISPSGFAAQENWQSGRVTSSDQRGIEATTSGLEVRHRVGLSGALAIRTGRWATDVSLFYVGESGAPFTYIAAAGRGRGDLNADGTSLNDPIYIPLNASDTGEIQFSGSPAEIAAQQSAFESLIATTPCLRDQRGRIMRRNSCRAPWSNLANLSLRQQLPSRRGQRLTLEVDVFNVLNLLNPQWGKLRVVAPSPNPSLLNQVGQTAGSPSESQPEFKYNPIGARFDSENLQSAYQLQFGVRYSF